MTQGLLTSNLEPMKRNHRGVSEYILYAAVWCIPFTGARLLGQATPVATGSTAGESAATQLPLSGRGAASGSVSTTQSVPNNGTNSVNVINSTVTLTGPYAGSVSGATAAELIQPLTLDHALALGLRNNLGQVSQSNSVLQAKGQRLVARSALLPNVSSTLGETLEKINLAAQGFRSPIVPIPGIPATVGPINFFDARAVKLNQTLVDFAQLRNLRSASQNVKSIQASALDARDLVVLAVAGSYLQVVAAQARVVAARAQVESSRASYQQAADRFEAGTNARIDVTRSQVQYQTDVQRLRADQADVERQKLTLSRIVGLPNGSVYGIEQEFPFTPLQDLNVEAALKRANENRADLLSAKQGVQAAESSLSAAHSEYLPSFSFTGDYGALGVNPAQAHGTFTIAGTITVPIFQGGRVQGDSEQARATLNQRKAELQDTFGVIDRDVREAFIDLNAAADQVGVAESNVSLANETSVQARDRFMAGVTDTVEVVQAEQAVAQANNDYISAVFEHNMAKVALSRAMGQAEITVKQLLRSK